MVFTVWENVGWFHVTHAATSCEDSNGLHINPGIRLSASKALWAVGYIKKDGHHDHTSFLNEYVFLEPTTMAN
jgi:hypothetical protein